MIAMIVGLLNLSSLPDTFKRNYPQIKYCMFQQDDPFTMNGPLTSTTL